MLSGGSFLSKPSPMQALTNSTMEYENLESEVSALHDDLWEQLNLDIQVKRALSWQGLPLYAVGLPLSFCPKETKVAPFLL